MLQLTPPGMCILPIGSMPGFAQWTPPARLSPLQATVALATTEIACLRFKPTLFRWELPWIQRVNCITRIISSIAYALFSSWAARRGAAKMYPEIAQPHKVWGTLDAVRYNEGAFDLAAPCNKQSRTCVTCLQKFSEN